MKNEKQNPRREFLSTTIKGASLLAVGLAVSPFTQIFAAPAFAESELEFRTKLAMLGTLSLLASEVATDKASNERVKMFAKFEVAEQTAIATVLKEMATPTPAADTKATAMLTKLKGLSGAAFDVAYMAAQVDTHQQLRSLVESFVSSSKNSSNTAEMHTRHIATVALATIKEHVEMSQMLSAMLK